jgi:hypothetical protein
MFPINFQKTSNLILKERNEIPVILLSSNVFLFGKSINMKKISTEFVCTSDELIHSVFRVLMSNVLRNLIV